MASHFSHLDPRAERTARYVNDVFGAGPRDEQLRTLMERAAAAGLPDIAVSGDVGRLLQLLSTITTHEAGAKGLVIEVGTLAGYSGIWLGRGLAPSARLITIDVNPEHADFARGEFRKAGLHTRVRQEVAPALECLPRLAKELGPASIDMAFIDAVKTEYAAYLALLKPMLRPGGLLAVDNALGSDWWITDPAGSSESRDAMDRFNRALAADRDFDCACITNRQGVLVARKR